MRTLGPADYHALRTMNHDTAERFLAQFEGITEDELSVAHTLIGRDLDKSPARTVVSRYDPDRRLWLCAAHILGASLRQLGKLHGVSASTITQSIDKLLPVAIRDQSRFSRFITLERLSAFHVKYYQSLDIVRGMTPQECAQWLAMNIEED